MKVSQDFSRSFGWSFIGDGQEDASLLNLKKFYFSIPLFNLYAAIGETASYNLSTGEKWRIGLAYTIVPLFLVDVVATVKNAIEYRKANPKALVVPAQGRA